MITELAHYLDALGVGAAAWFIIRNLNTRLNSHAEALRSIREKYVRRDDFKDCLDRIESRLQCLDTIKRDIGEMNGILNSNIKGSSER